MTRRRVLIIGLDGATWDVLDDTLVEAHMPHLHRLRTAGAYGVLQSCQPPVTAAAWTTCITGCQPYTHGVVGFKEYRCGDDSIHITSAATCRVPNLWRQLSDQGLTVASINVPWTYPCPPVNGVVVSGYGTPGTHVDFTWPPRFKQELLDKMPDFDFLAPWKEADPSDSDAFEANMRAVERC
ncbi:MAG TPA: phosphodiesterase, partial [Phycisphaerales bacterium]|nr:phosphodiesterase [Phycisphaerales bacterium]